MKDKFQIFLSYLGLLPFIYILLDIQFFQLFSLILLKDLSIYYSLIIITFIGAMRWSFRNDSKLYEILYGFFLLQQKRVFALLFLQLSFW